MLIGLFILLFTLIGMGMVYFAWYVFSNFQPGKSRISKDIDEMRADVKQFLPELMPWDGDELELLSLHQTDQIVKQGIVTTAKGIFTSIYQEPMVAYSYKKYVAPGINAVLYARTAKHEFVYRIRNKATFITMNGQLLGELRADGRLFNGKGSELLAEIEKNDSEVLALKVRGRDMGALTRVKLQDDLYPRAFNLLPDNISSREEVLLLSVSVYEMVNQSVGIENKDENKN